MQASAITKTQMARPWPLAHTNIAPLPMPQKVDQCGTAHNVYAIALSPIAGGVLGLFDTQPAVVMWRVRTDERVRYLGAAVLQEIARERMVARVEAVDDPQGAP